MKKRVKAWIAKVLGIEDITPGQLAFDYKVIFNTDKFLEDVKKLLVYNINLIPEDVCVSIPECDRCIRYKKGPFQSYCPNCGNKLKD